MELTGRYYDLVRSYDKTIKEYSENESKAVSPAPLLQRNIFGELNPSGVIIPGFVSESCTLPSKIPILNNHLDDKCSKLSYTDYFEVAARRNVALDFLKKSQHSSRKARPWGAKTKLKEFRYQAGEKIKEGGAIIDRFVGVENSTMLTLTLPGDTWYAFDALARWSGWIVNRLTQLFRRLPKSLPKPYWFFVWEHQKRGALHMHWCIGWKVNRLKRERLCYRIKNLWFTLLEEISVKEKIDLFKGRGFKPTHRYNRRVWKWDVQQIKSSVSAYFAKYCVKNSSLSKLAADTGSRRPEHESRKTRKRVTSPNRTCPSRYWGSSQTIKRWAKRLRVECKWVVDSPEFSNTILNRIRGLLPNGQSYRSVTVVPFEVIEPTTGICISSGETETYVVAPHLYPMFHKYVCEQIMERPYRMDAMDIEFLNSQSARPIINTVD